MRRAVLTFAILSVPAAAFGQFPSLSDLASKLAERVPGLSKILETPPAISTGLDDATRGVPMLDGFTPDSFAPLAALPKDAAGGFVLHPGAFELDAQSYCLHAGTSRPRGGDGYLFAPLAGPDATLIASVLDHSLAHPEIAEPDIQLLIWGLLARARIDEMDPDVQAAAAALLSPDQIEHANAGALALVPEELRDRAFADAPPPVQRVLEAEAELRDKLTDGETAYDEIADVAAPDEDPDPQPGDREIPEGRWSLHPGGFFVRYLPNGYTETRIQVYVPEHVAITQDALGRIVRLTDPDGGVIETSYDDTVAPLEVPGDPSLKGYAFKSIRYREPASAGGAPRVAAWDDVGWTFVRASAGPAAPRPAMPRLLLARWTGAAPRPAPSPDGDGSRFDGWRNRYNTAKGYYDDATDLRDRLRIAHGPRTQADVGRLTDLKHYQDGLKAATGANLTDKGKWIAKHTEIVSNAWRYAACMLGGGCNNDKPHYQPSHDVAVPGRGGAQRLGLSGRGH